jgi:two-component system cell cycle response regulator DivK
LQKLILVAEDDATTLKLYRDLLNALGYRVSEATDGNEAVQCAIRDMPDLVIMDMKLPVMSGDDAARLIKANPATGHIPIIAVTASVMKGQEQEMLDAGCDGYICKPFDINILAEMIKEFIPPGS